jgi:hypothetical protein
VSADGSLRADARRSRERILAVAERSRRSGPPLLRCVVERRTKSGDLLGPNGLGKILARLEGASAAATARGVQEAVVAASDEPLSDDAALLVLAVG